LAAQVEQAVVVATTLTVEVAGGVNVVVAVVLGLRPKQLHPEESCFAAKADSAGRLMRFSMASRLSSSATALPVNAGAGHVGRTVLTVVVEVVTVATGGTAVAV
jgi:hypothetical protein